MKFSGLGLIFNIHGVVDFLTRVRKCDLTGIIGFVPGHTMSGDQDRLMKQQTANEDKRLPFLEAVCWDLHDVYALTPTQMLTRYEKGLEYDGVLANLEQGERAFIETLKRKSRAHAA